MSSPISHCFAAASLASILLACAGSTPNSDGSPRPSTPTVAEVEIPERSKSAGSQSTKEVAASEQPSPQDPLLESWNARLADARKARQEQDHAGARARIAQAIELALAELGAREDPAALAALERLGLFAHDAGELRSAGSALSRVLEVRSRTLPGDHLDLQRVRGNLAGMKYMQGDLAGARALLEQVLEVRSRTLPDEHPDVQTSRGNLAVAMKAQGDLAGARALEEKVLEVRARTLPDEHPLLQAARGNLALTIKAQGDLAGARVLEEKVFEVRSRTLPDEHPELQKARVNLADTRREQGDLAGARALFEAALVVNSRTLPDAHPDLQSTRANLSATIAAQGDLAGARALCEKVLEVSSRTLSDDHPELLAAQQNLAATLWTQGDLAGARALFERVLEVRSRTLSDEHADLQGARTNLAVTLYKLGDFAGARALQEKVLEVDSRVLSDEHPDLQQARVNLAATVQAQGDVASARALFEKALDVGSRTLPDEHPDLQRARLNLAGTMNELGDFAGAGALQEKVLEVRSRTLPDEHPDLQLARGNRVGTIAAELARASDEARETGRKRCVELIAAICRSQTSAARATLLEASPREAEIRCQTHGESLSQALSLVEGLGVFAPSRELEAACFVLSETTRGAALVSASLMRLAAKSPSYAELRGKLESQSGELSALAHHGTTNEEFRRALLRRESVERDLVALATELRGAASPDLALDVDALAAELAEQDALVAYRRYTRLGFTVAADARDPASPAPVGSSMETMLAFVLRRGYDASEPNLARARLGCVDLGPLEPIEQAVHAWRESLGSGADARGLTAAPAGADAISSTARASAVRALVFDPLRAAIGDATRVVVALDDVLHLVPLDALPLADSAPAADGRRELVGERWRIETRCTVTELLAANAPRGGAQALVSLGGAEFDGEPLAPDAEDVEAPEPLVASSLQISSMLRGGAWSRGFSPLPHTLLEAREIAALCDEVVGDDARSVMLEKRKASRTALEALAPRARWLHIATHGWFTPESIKSWSDPEAIDAKSGLAFRQSGEQQIKGMSPMLLCGLALAGANLPENALGRAPGLVTADEISTLDLSQCELAVLSACDTNVGERRAGQGVASLQKALQMAGARSVITSLWKVPDEATRELMVDFYRRIWVEKKPKWQALWEAKMKLRNAKDESGNPKYSTRDWAAWVLTGEPR